MVLNKFADVPFIALETFRKNGEGVITPVWVVGENGKLYIWTNLDSWKVKRIQTNNRVRVCESDVRGNPKSDWLHAQGRLLDNDEALKKVRSLFKSKYGFQFSMFSLMGRKSPKAVVEITQF